MGSPFEIPATTPIALPDLPSFGRYWTALSSIVFDAAFAFGGMLVVVVVVVVDIELVGSLGPLGLSLLKSLGRALV